MTNPERVAPEDDGAVASFGQEHSPSSDTERGSLVYTRRFYRPLLLVLLVTVDDTQHINLDVQGALPSYDSSCILERLR